MIDPSVSVVGTQLSSTLLVVGGIQWLKKSKWFPWIQQGQKVATRVFSAVIAFAVAIGIHYTWNPTDNGTLILTGINAWSILHGLFHVAAQFIYQETGYNVLAGLTAMQQIYATLKSAVPPEQKAA